MLLACCTQKISLNFTCLLQGMIVAAGASSMIRTVKILALHSPRDPDVVIDLLKCFPCVEKLYMVGFISLIW